ncbi:MAG: hypothetical protein ACREKK_12525, partial [Candidatus Methylomirabilales bacterium]
MGPWVPLPKTKGSRRARLFLFVDDFSRLLVYGRWVTEENARSGQLVLRGAIACRGGARGDLCRSGRPIRLGALARTCGVLGIRLV